MSALTSEILFEKFQIIEVLKKDEHAAVFLANHIYLAKKIILKILNTQKISDQSLVERFKREAKILAKLDHPHIIKVLDFGMHKEYFYISFEYIEGVSLRNLMKKEELSFEQKKHLTVQLLKGLHYAHHHQIVHRDIKPENVFIDANLNAKLGDFGLALSAEDNFVTNPYSIVGTPSYMSPEQVRGAKLTAQSDLFSVGVLLFELFTGKNPFLKDNITLTLNEIMSYDENSLSEGLNELPQEIKKLLYNLLRKNQKERYASALEALNELNISPDQLTVNLAYESIKEKKFPWKGITAIATVVVILTVYIILGIIDSQQQRLPNQTQNDPTSFQQNAQSASQQNKNETDQAFQNKKQIDLDNLNQPLIADKKQDQKTNEQNTNPDAAKKVIQYGGLFIECLPWAKIYINGEEFETTPLNRPINLQEGEYTLKLVHPDYPVYTKIVSVKAEQVTNIRVLLDSMMGFIGCKVFPWGNVYVNGELKGQTPLRDLIRVNPGSIRLTIKNPSYKEIDTTFFIRAGDTLKFKFSFKNN